MKFFIKFLSKLENIEYFVVSENQIYHTKNGILYINNLGLINDEIPFASNSTYIYSNLIFSGKDFYYDTISKSVKYIQELVGYYYSNVFDESNLLFGKSDMVLYNIESKKIVYKGDFFCDRSPNIIYGNLFICRGENFFSSYNYLDKNTIWLHSFSDLLDGVEIHQAGNIVVFEGKAYFYLYDDKGGNKATICIDINTGEVLHTYDNFGGDLFLFGNKIGAAAYGIVQVLNLETNEVREYDFSQTLQEHNLKICWNRNVFTEDGLLYFIGTNEAKNKVGILDLNTEQLLWHTSFDISETECNINQQVRNIQLQGCRLYVHCSDNTLHIFENTNS